MKCPCCTQAVSLFSPAINRFGRIKQCPHCGGEVKLSIAIGAMALWLLPAILLALLLHPWMGSFATGLAVAVATALSMRLKSHD